jgi:hypothetical protein
MHDVLHISVQWTRQVPLEIVLVLGYYSCWMMEVDHFMDLLENTSLVEHRSSLERV